MMPRERISFERCVREKSPSGQEVCTWAAASGRLTDVPAERVVDAVRAAGFKAELR